MKKFFILFFGVVIVFMSSCSNFNTNNVNLESAGEIENLYSSNEYLDIDNIIARGEGFIDISDEEFIKKANTITLATTESDLTELFGKSFGMQKETNINTCYYFNDHYFLSVLPGVTVTICDIYNQEDVTVIASIE